jgi:hypothetical protein
VTVQTNSKLHIELDFAQLNDTDRANLLAGIQQLGPQSPLFAANPIIQTAVASLGQAGAALKTAEDAVTVDESKLQLDKVARDDARAKFDKALVLLKNLVENDAHTEADVTSMSFKLRGPKASKSPLTAPQGILVRLGKVHGQFTVSAKDTGTQKHYAAEISPDPVGPASWTGLPGSGKARTVTGYKSGMVVWVRFATLSKQQQSDWCTPVSVTVP